MQFAYEAKGVERRLYDYEACQVDQTIKRNYRIGLVGNYVIWGGASCSEFAGKMYYVHVGLSVRSDTAVDVQNCDMRTL